MPTRPLSLFAALLLTLIPLTAQPMPAVPTAPTAPNVGAVAPSFELPSTTGAGGSLTALLQAGPVAVVFVRSADWCPYCRRQLQELQSALPEFAAAGLQVIAISYDAPEASQQAATKLGLTFPLLSDVGSQVINAYGILNQEAKGRAEGIPHPAVFVIDATGQIVAKLQSEGYKDRPAPADIIGALAPGSE